MNNAQVFARIQAEDYEGTRPINGVERPTIYRENANSVSNASSNITVESTVGLISPPDPK